jgi:hypothetical protein
MLHFFKSKQFQLRIDNPCSENWEEMLPAEKGKFCQSCSKNVIDFTTLSDKEIIAFVSKSSSTLCGRISADQLNHTFSYKKEFSLPPLFQKIAAGLLFLGLSEHVQASEKKSAPITFSQLPEKESITKTSSTDSLIVFKGVVMDSVTKEPIPFASIIIKGEGFDVFADG